MSMKGQKAQKTLSEEKQVEQHSPERNNESPPKLRSGESGEGDNEKTNSIGGGLFSASDADLFSFMSAMHLSGGGFAPSPSSHSSRKRKFLERSSGKSSWLRGNYSPQEFHPYSLLHSSLESSSHAVDEGGYGAIRFSRKNTPHHGHASNNGGTASSSGILSEIVDENLAANFDDSLSGLGVDINAVASGSYGVSEALLALPNLSISSSQVQNEDEAEMFKDDYGEDSGSKGNQEEDENELLNFDNFGGSHPNLSLTTSSVKLDSSNYPLSRRLSNPKPSTSNNSDESAKNNNSSSSSSSKDVEKLNSPQANDDPDNQFEYMLMAASSMATKINEPSITYLNQGHSYELRLRKLGDLSRYRKRILKTKIRICFHERRLQYSEAEQIAEWSNTHPGERILDLDIANSYGILEHVRDSNQLNALTFKWDPTRETAISIKVNCISTEFTPKKHGGEKGVPFRLQVETYDSEDPCAARLHAAGCILQIFKLKGADRKHKQDREKIAKKTPTEQEQFAKPCKTTVLKDLAIDNIYIPQQSNLGTRADTPGATSDKSEPKQGQSKKSSDQQSYKDEFILSNSYSNEVFTPQNVDSPDVVPSKKSEPPPETTLETPSISATSTPNETSSWLAANRFDSYSSILMNYDGRDLLRLNREEAMSLMGPAEGIRFYNAMHSVTIPPRSTFYVAQKNSSEFHALFLEGYSVSEFIKKFALVLGVHSDIFFSVLLVGPLGILVKVTDSVVKYMRPETIFYFSLRSSSDQLDSCDIILEEVSAFMQHQHSALNNNEDQTQEVLDSNSGVS